MNGIEVFREIDNTNELLLGWLEAREQLFPVLDNKGNERLFVENDKPRDADITPLIMTATKGFALFSDEGKYIGSYRSLDRAIEAQGSAKLVVTADVADAEPDEIITEDEPVFYEPEGEADL